MNSFSIFWTTLVVISEGFIGTNATSSLCIVLQPKLPTEFQPSKSNASVWVVLGHLWMCNKVIFTKIFSFKTRWRTFKNYSAQHLLVPKHPNVSQFSHLNFFFALYFWISYITDQWIIRRNLYFILFLNDLLLELLLAEITLYKAY